MEELPPINFICIDEAHCITTLSHNFRPSYLKLIDLIAQKFGPNKTILALTGTATIATQKQICQLLKIDAENSDCVMKGRVFLV
jgi:ATP-dependent DNA helicase RecQ